MPKCAFVVSQVPLPPWVDAFPDQYTLAACAGKAVAIAATAMRWALPQARNFERSDAIVVQRMLKRSMGYPPVEQRLYPAASRQSIEPCGQPTRRPVPHPGSRKSNPRAERDATDWAGALESPFFLKKLGQFVPVSDFGEESGPHRPGAYDVTRTGERVVRFAPPDDRGVGRFAPAPCGEVGRFAPPRHRPGGAPPAPIG